MVVTWWVEMFLDIQRLGNSRRSHAMPDAPCLQAVTPHLNSKFVVQIVHENRALGTGIVNSEKFA